MGKVLIESKNDYQNLVDECRGLVVEGVHNANWKLIETYWTLGKNVREYVQKYKKDSGELIARLANDIKLSKRTIYYALQAYDKYPDITYLPEGKAITWYKLITKYLPNPRKTKEVEEKEEFCECPKCGFVFKPVKKVTKVVNAIVHKKYSSLKDITDSDIEDIATSYNVSITYVKLQYEKLKNYCESKGRKYKNYKSALRNFVLGNLERMAERRIPDNGKRGVDARQA